MTGLQNFRSNTRRQAYPPTPRSGALAFPSTKLSMSETSQGQIPSHCATPKSWLMNTRRNW